MGCGLRRDSDSRPRTRAALDTPCATRPVVGGFDVASYGWKHAHDAVWAPSDIM